MKRGMAACGTGLLFKDWRKQFDIAGEELFSIEGQNDDGVYMLANGPSEYNPGYPKRFTATYFLWINGKLVRELHSSRAEAVATYYRLKEETI